MSDSFDLLTEPWIPVVNVDGSAMEVGLRAALTDAHLYTGIRDPIPLVEFGQYRLLTALVSDIFEPKNTAELARLLRAGRFTAGTITAYFDEWSDRFRLFGKDYPFLQTAAMGDRAAVPLASVLPSVPSGTNALHFHHANEKEFAVCPAAAARLLTTISPFMTAGGAGLSPSINGAPPWYVLINGRSLFETLCLNVCAIPVAPAPNSDAPPAWRNPREPGGDRRTTYSLLEGLTWRPRRIRLLRDYGGTCSMTGCESVVLVRAMQYAAGDACDFMWRDPSVPYKTAGQDRTPLRVQEGRPVWRDTGPIVLLNDKDYESEKGNVQFERPPLISQWPSLIEREALPDDASLDLTIYGMRTDMKMKIFEWRRERLSVPASLIEGSRFKIEAQRAMDRASEVENALRKAIKRTYPRDGKGNDSALHNVISGAKRRYWNGLSDSYDNLLRDLASLKNGADTTGPRENWHRQVRLVAGQSFELAVGDLDADADAIRRQVEARTYFHACMAAILATDEQRAARAVSRSGRKKT